MESLLHILSWAVDFSVSSRLPWHPGYGFPGEDIYWRDGISACAVCDGAVRIFRNKPLVVIGGGDSAAEEAMVLTKYASSVTVLVRRDALRVGRTMARRLLSCPKVEVMFSTIAVVGKGEDKANWLLTTLLIENVKTGVQEELPASGLFYAIGHDAATKIFQAQVDSDDEGNIITTPDTTHTSRPGVFAAGNVQDKRFRQAITSAGTGCMAALEPEAYLAGMGE